MAVWDIERFLQWYKYSILIGQMSSFDWLIPDQPIRVEFLEVLKSPLNKYQLFLIIRTDYFGEWKKKFGRPSIGFLPWTKNNYITHLYDLIVMKSSKWRHCYVVTF